MYLWKLLYTAPDVTIVVCLIQHDILILCYVALYPVSNHSIRHQGPRCPAHYTDELFLWVKKSRTIRNMCALLFWILQTAIQRVGMAVSVYSVDCGNIAHSSCYDWNETPSGLLLSGCLPYRAFSLPSSRNSLGRFWVGYMYTGMIEFSSLYPTDT